MTETKSNKARKGSINNQKLQGGYCEGVREQIEKALHDLCQPLTTLQCRLEVAQMIGSPEACREAIDLGMQDCAKLYAAVGILRDIVITSTQ